MKEDIFDWTFSSEHPAYLADSSKWYLPKKEGKMIGGFNGLVISAIVLCVTFIVFVCFVLTIITNIDDRIHPKDNKQPQKDFHKYYTIEELSEIVNKTRKR